MTTEEIPREWFVKNEHISDTELEKDIADTEREIHDCDRVAGSYSTLAVHDFTRPHEIVRHRMRAEQAVSDMVSGKALLNKLLRLQQWRANGRP